MKNIFIDVSFYNYIKTGIGVYVHTLLKCFELTHFAYVKKELIIPNSFRFKSIFLIHWQNTILYIKTLFQKPDIIIFPAFTMPYFTRKKTKYITVIHDLCHLRVDETTKYSRFIFDLSTKIAIKKADIIVTVSNTIRQELIKKFNISPDRIKVVYNSIGEHFINANINPEILEKYNIKKEKYILSVATLNKRKNIPELIKAFESISDKYPELKLVLVGGMGNEDREKLTKHPNIIFTGYIPDDDLPTLYRNALIYVFPSLYEGFGTPIIEAQHSGTPLICSDIPVFKEVAGEGAEFCKTDHQSIAEKIEFLINNPTRRNELINLENNNVKRFAIENVANQLINVLES